ncbi:trigger factor [Helicobacter mustelae]|uniref:Trigger factor n=1 Tax=Helicobacter mustelae (strain ATCC 43772 / CCUG 25715 / CIP 103759 / LMG 18044 / NCTC 12198 / R85-136P) TaxID=679897 RepID=D3UIF8_HELM1|nr:trigger factor [Helicobacter mustelae]CBG40281.1 trigger factor (peptidyl-prolyl cis /trans isomerase, chaperone) [Helicobacter mustelae 12198]SQH71781.1 peptidyl-prolyl cis /trans isomerase [Helicobacter mustelae]STP12910.1 peptidyl-prolyl cis /trans isomerase [Helicobacter mustelae]
MELRTNKINSANVIASGVITLKDLEDKITKIATRLSKTMKLDGFRKGKVPLQLIRSRYQDSIRQDAQKDAIQEMLQHALKDLHLDARQVLGDPMMTKMEEKDGGFDVEIKISLTPDIPLDSVPACIPEVKVPRVTEEEVKTRLEEIAKREAPLIDAPKDKRLENDDVAVFDFEGFVDGKPFEGGKAENFELIIGSGSFVPGFEDAMLGMLADEAKEISITFPAEYHVKHLASKDATFKVKLHAIKVKDKPQINDDLAKKLLPQNATASLRDLDAEIKKQLELEAKTKVYNEELKEKLVENFLEKIHFDLPDLVIEQEMDLLFRNSLSSIAEEELKTLQENPEKAKEKRESFRDEAKNSVQVTFIIDALAKQKNITVQDNEVFQTVYYEAMMMGQNPTQIIEYYKSNNLLPAIKMAMVEDRVLQNLLDTKVEFVDKLPQKSEDKAKEGASKKESKRAVGRVRSPKKGDQ